MKRNGGSNAWSDQIDDFPDNMIQSSLVLLDFPMTCFESLHKVSPIFKQVAVFTPEDTCNGWIFRRRKPEKLS